MRMEYFFKGFRLKSLNILNSTLGYTLEENFHKLWESVDTPFETERKHFHQLGVESF